MLLKNLFPTFVFTSCLALATLGSAAEMKLDTTKPKNFADSPTIIVPTVYLKLPVAGKVFVSKQGGALSVLGGGSANSVKASAHYSVEGLTKELAQKIAARVQDDFVAKLREAGFTVKTYDDLKDIEDVKTANRDKNDPNWGMPLEKDPSGNTVFVIATPSDEQSFKAGLAGGVFNPFMKRGKSTLGEGTIVIPTYVISAPQAWGETGRGYKTISAGVNVAPGMNLTFAMASLLTSKGGWGDARTKEQIINISENVGELAKQDKTDHAGNAFSSALSVLTGSGKITGTSADYQLKVNVEAYEQGVLNGAGSFNSAVARIAQDAKK